MKLRIRSMIWNIRKQKQPIGKQKEYKDKVSSLWDNFKRSNNCILGVPEGEEKEQEIGNLFEKTMKRNFPNLVKEIDMQVQGGQGVPNKMDAHSKTPNN